MKVVIFGAGPPALCAAKSLLRRGASVTLIANYFPDGQMVAGAQTPTYFWAAGIQMPFGGGPTDPRMNLYWASHPEMIRLADDPGCAAVRRCELRSLIEPGPRPEWANRVDNYRREDTPNNAVEVYSTAAFDPPGLLRFWWEELRQQFPETLLWECRDLNSTEVNSLRSRIPPPGFDAVVASLGIGGQQVYADGTDEPVLGVLLHLPGDGQTQCWMDERKPEGTSGLADEPDCFYAIRRPRYLGRDQQDPQGRIVLGGTIKPGVSKLSQTDLDALAPRILAGCNRNFGESFSMSDVLEVTQCRRPGNRNGFQLIVESNRFCAVRGPGGMGIVMAPGIGEQIAQTICG